MLLATLAGAGVIGTDVILFLDNVTGIGVADDVLMTPVNLALVASGAIIINELIVKRRQLPFAAKRSWLGCLRCYASDMAQTNARGLRGFIKYVWRLRLVKGLTLVGAVQMVLIGDDVTGALAGDNILQVPVLMAWLVLLGRLIARIVPYRWYDAS